MSEQIDNDGYPTEEELERIRTADVTTPEKFHVLMESFKEVWSHYGGWERKGNFYRLATGGWSGNEDIIGALSDNHMFWLFYWELSQRGGLYIFGARGHVLDDYDNEQKLIRDLL